MSRERVLRDFHSPAEAKKAEESVKTGYSEAIIETLTHWLAAEEDLCASYRDLSAKSSEDSLRGVYSRLALQSESNLILLKDLLSRLEEMDRERVERIRSVESLVP